MARILWLLPDPTGAHQPGGMDPPKATFVSLAAMAKRPQPLPATAAPWRAEVPRGGCRRLADWVLAHVRTPGGPTGPAQPVFRRPRSSPTLCLCPSLTRSNRRGTDPYARWCGRGGTARCPPIPINPLCRLRQSGFCSRRPWDLLAVPDSAPRVESRRQACSHRGGAVGCVPDAQDRYSDASTSSLPAPIAGERAIGVKLPSATGHRAKDLRILMKSMGSELCLDVDYGMRLIPSCGYDTNPCWCPGSYPRQKQIEPVHKMPRIFHKPNRRPQVRSASAT
jgi:hypothetical protein